MTDNPTSRNTTLVFDWGDTLMKVFPQYTGPMADWPEVSPVEGAADALRALSASGPLVVAANARESDVPQVWRALKRAGLDKYIQAVFTSQVLGNAQKPEPLFFRQIESVMDLASCQLVMIGDDYARDILGAKSAGWRAIWYNPGYQPAAGAVPLHDVEIADLSELPAAASRPPLPNYSACLVWLAERGTPFNILAHVNLVAAAAYLMALWLAQSGEPINPVLAHRGGLLHDLAKMDSIRAGKERGESGDHADMARVFLEARGQPELAQIADRHMIYNDPNYARRPLTWEQKVVNYADKLADNSRLVSIAERLEGLKARYPNETASLEASLAALAPLQAEICSRLSLTPAALVERLRNFLGLFE